MHKISLDEEENAGARQKVDGAPNQESQGGEGVKSVRAERVEVTRARRWRVEADRAAWGPK
jgi:hypothetical protein